MNMVTEKTIEQTVEEKLTRDYGQVREKIQPGIDWLMGKHLSSYPPCLDHPEYRIKDGKRTIDARPYICNFSQSFYETLVEIAREKNLYLFIERRSNYNQGTILIILTEVNVHPLKESE